MILANHGIISSSTLQTTLLTNLYAVYKAESNANDSLGGYNGTAQGGLTYSTGKSGNAFTFNGSNAYVNYADNAFNFTGDFSVNLWVYFNSSPSGAQYDIIQSVRQNSLNTGWKFVVRLGKPEVQFYNNSALGALWYTPSLDLVANTWYNISIVNVFGQIPSIKCDNVSYTVGLRAGNSAVTDPQYTSPCYSVIGAAKYDTGSLGNYMPSNSKLDEVALWNKALTTQEETELYNSGTGKFYPIF
jgi:hypothetical protein